MSGHDGDEVNTGTLAHRILERWIRTAGYLVKDPQDALAEAADACVSELHGPVPTNWRMSRARLIARGGSLVDLIGDRPPDRVLSEIELQDDDLRLRGQLDLLLLGDEYVVVDLKTQTLFDNELPEWVKFQLTLYAYLVQRTYRTVRVRAEVLSLNRGRREVPITEASLREALAELTAARAAEHSLASPSPEACEFCDRRLVCGPHWEVVTTWPDGNAVEGVVERAERAATGVVALRLVTPDGPAWVAGIPAVVGDVSPGDRVRLVRLGRVDGLAADGGDREWRWRRLSAFRKVLASDDAD